MASIKDAFFPAFESIPTSLIVVGVTLLLFFSYKAYTTFISERPYPNIPIAKLDGYTPKSSWYHHGNDLVRKGLKQYSGPFQIVTGAGPRVVLRNEVSEEVRKNNDTFGFKEAAIKDFFADYHGFNGFRGFIDNPELLPEMIRTKLTQSLGLITDDLVEETTEAIHDIFGESDQWQVVKVQDSVLETVARLSSRVFLGKDLCRNRQWLDITKTYTVNLFSAAQDLRTVPGIIRPLYQWFNKHCKNLRDQVKDAKYLIHSEVEKRKLETQKALASGGKAPKMADTIGWLVEVASKQGALYSTDTLVGDQLGLSFAAIHTTTLTICFALLDIIAHPEVVQPLRNEIISVLTQYGMNREALYKLRIMDSFLKESQRFLIPAAVLNREVLHDYRLRDGTVIPKGHRIMVATNFYDPAIYPDPHKFDAERFSRMRERPGEENRWQFVTTSTEHLGFGYGKHACPGRFFVSNEIKIALCHLLLKYDFASAEEKNVSPTLEVEANPFVNPEAKIKLRRRQEEIPL